MKKFLIIIICFSITSFTFIYAEEDKQVIANNGNYIGMTKEELIEIKGEPVKQAEKDGVLYYEYIVCYTKVVLQDDIVTHQRSNCI